MIEGVTLPVVRQLPVSLIVANNAELEAIALRSVLEVFNCRVEIHWVGSRGQFLDILKNIIPTTNLVILSCHGDAGGMLLMPYEPAVGDAELAAAIQLPGRVVLSLGCRTGTPEIAEAFIAGGCHAYIAPTEDIEGNTALLFAIHLFYALAAHRPLEEAVVEAQAYDTESRQFTGYRRTIAGDMERIQIA